MFSIPIALFQSAFSDDPTAHFPRGDAFQIIHRVMIDDGGERAVQFGNFCFVFIAKCNVKDVQVLRRTFGVGGFCQHDDVAFHQPAGNPCATDLPYFVPISD